ncbi:hypothetical protein LXL04_020761 [Taraxacum kok-saghyz]
MSSSSSSVGNRGSNGRRIHRFRSRCYCGDPVGRWTAWTPINRERRFLGCPNFQVEHKHCEYFYWLDPPVPNQWYGGLLLEIHNNDNNDNLENNGNLHPPGVFGDFAEGVAIQHHNGNGDGRIKVMPYVVLIMLVLLILK